jgi:DNA-binding protein HU-beta
MNKQEFVDRVAQKSGLSKKDAATAVNASLDSITDSLSRGEEVTFTGFGKFSAQQRAARRGVNPRNPSERVYIPAARVPKFSAGSRLKDAVAAWWPTDAADAALPGDPDVPWEDDCKDEAEN